jgi:hypothetical protein
MTPGPDDEFLMLTGKIRGATGSRFGKGIEIAMQSIIPSVDPIDRDCQSMRIPTFLFASLSTDADIRALQLLEPFPLESSKYVVGDVREGNRPEPLLSIDVKEPVFRGFTSYRATLPSLVKTLAILSALIDEPQEASSYFKDTGRVSRGSDRGILDSLGWNPADKHAGQMGRLRGRSG